jgi:hypothetical protein
MVLWRVGLEDAASAAAVSQAVHQSGLVWTDMKTNFITHRLTIKGIDLRVRYAFP